MATGAELRNAEGILVGHIVRKFDAEGRIIAEKQAADAPQVNLPEEFRSKLNPERMKSVGTMIAGMQNCVISYSYDAQGRVTERHRSGGVFVEQLTVTTYNDHGDKASERETTVMRPDTHGERGLAGWCWHTNLLRWERKTSPTTLSVTLAVNCEDDRNSLHPSPGADPNGDRANEDWIKPVIPITVFILAGVPVHGCLGEGHPSPTAGAARNTRQANILSATD